ncbi:hypothetical protein TNCV_356811 [Trichonephila clavipes]|nr:hypothetical protein TNCV_356811 [Trichonephila clavipes]
MSKNGLKQISQEISFKWYFLTLSQVIWADIENCVEFLSKERSDIKIDDNCLFEMKRKLNVYLNSNQLEQVKNQHAEKLTTHQTSSHDETKRQQCCGSVQKSGINSVTPVDAMRSIDCMGCQRQLFSLGSYLDAVYAAPRSKRSFIPGTN